MATLIVDDNEDMRRLVRLLIDLTDGEEIVAEAADAQEGLARFREHHPDVVVLDYRLPGVNGLDVAEEILDEVPGTTILLFSAYLDDRAVARAERLGIRACVAKDQVREIPELVRKHGQRAS